MADGGRGSNTQHRGLESPVSVTTERLPRSQIQLEIEIAEERVERSKDQAVKRLANQMKIPGFRPGKAPRHLLERTIGEGALLQEALDDLIPEVYGETIESEEIEPVGQPEFDLKSTDPLVVSFTVPVRPTIDLKDYHSLRVPRPELEDDPGLVEEGLLDIRRRFATLEPVERPVQWDDTVRADVSVVVEGQDEPHEEQDAEFPVREGHVVSLPGFVEHLVGLEPGTEHHIEFALPEDFPAEEIAGKTAHYTVTLHEVKQEVLPDLDDEFVHSLDEEDIETAEQLRERMVSNVHAQQQGELDVQYQEEIVDLVVATAEIDYPEVLVEQELDRLIDETSNHQAHTREDLDKWLASIGQTEEEVRESLREQADLQVQRGIVLGDVARAEGIEVTAEEVEAELDKLVDGMQMQMGGVEPDEEQRAQLRSLFDTEQTRSSSENKLRLSRTLERLVEICAEPEDEAAEDAERPRGTRRRRSRARDESSEDGGAGGTEQTAVAATDEAASADAGEATEVDEQPQGTDD